MGANTDFWQVTGDELNYAMAATGFDDGALREKLMSLYLELDAYPEVPGVLQTLKDAGMKTAILSNGSPMMLDSAAGNADIAVQLDAVLSIEAVGIFKVSPKTYQLAVDRLSVAPEAICFTSSNAWDAAGATYFGFQVAWFNRFGRPKERLPGDPKAEITSLGPLPGLVCG